MEPGVCDFRSRKGEDDEATLGVRSRKTHVRGLGGRLRRERRKLFFEFCLNVEAACQLLIDFSPMRAFSKSGTGERAIDWSWETVITSVRVVT